MGVPPMLKICSFTSLYPNAEQPQHGIFVENRLQQLAASGRIHINVVAPVPYFPFSAQMFGRYGRYARVPRGEQRHGLEVVHPRYPVLPKVGMDMAPALMHRGVRRFFERWLSAHPGIQALDAHYFYPDGVAAAMLAADHNLPLVITARGSDISEIATFPGPRRRILRAAEQAQAIVTVCDALKRALIELGVAAEKIHTFRNGVDLTQFQPVPHEDIDRAFRRDGPLLLSVGHLIERKGHHLAIEALAKIPGAVLLIAGSGPEEGRLHTLAAQQGVEDRVHFLGQLDPDQLRGYYSAADALVLASSREGWANVLLESMACGTPVVATDIWGTGEVVRAPEAGELIAARHPDAIADGVTRLLQRGIDPAATRAYAERFSWQETTDNLVALFTRIAPAARDS